MSNVKYLLNSDFKILRKGDFVRASDQNGEFIYETEETADEKLTMGQMQEIAKMNKLKIHGKNKSEFRTKLNEALNSMENVAEQNTKPVTEIVEDIVKVGFAENLDDDDILVKIITAGVSFKQAGKLFNQAVEKLGLRISLKDVKGQVSEILEDMDFAPETWDDVEKAFAEFKEEESLEAADEKQLLQAVRAYCKENELELPKKPKGKRGATGIKGKVFAFILGNPDADAEALGKFGESEGKDPEKIIKQFGPILQLCKDYAEKTNSAE